MCSTSRRLGLHDGDPDCQVLHRRQGPDHLRRIQRNHERVDCTTNCQAPVEKKPLRHAQKRRFLLLSLLKPRKAFRINAKVDSKKWFKVLESWKLTQPRGYHFIVKKVIYLNNTRCVHSDKICVKTVQKICFIECKDLSENNFYCLVLKRDINLWNSGILL